MACQKRKYLRGFALMDVMIAMVIVATGVVAILQLFATGTPANAAAARVMIATRLAQNVYEYARTLDDTQLRAINGRTYSPVIDSAADPQEQGFGGWSQSVEVYQTRATDLTLNLPIGTNSAGMPKRLTVTVSRNGAAVHTEHWLLAPTLE